MKSQQKPGLLGGARAHPRTGNSLLKTQRKWSDDIWVEFTLKKSATVAPFKQKQQIPLIWGMVPYLTIWKVLI